MPYAYRNYTDAQIIEHSKTVKSMADLLRKLGLQPIGGNYHTMRKNLARLNINTSHWLGMGWTAGAFGKSLTDYQTNKHAKRFLINEIGHKCQKCNLSRWLEEPITLELDHIDGDRFNNSKNNLQLLCPNCHSQTPHWRRRKFTVA